MERIKYTKIQKIYEQNNDMVHNYYYIYYGRLYNDDHTRYRSFKYILCFDIFDLQEYYDEDIITKEQIKDFARALTESIDMTYLDGNIFNNKTRLKEFYDFCGTSIDDYNKIIKGGY